MNRRYLVRTSGIGLLTLVGCGASDSSERGYLSTIESLEDDNRQLRREVTQLQESITPTPSGTPAPAHMGSVADRSSVEFDGWILQSVGYAPLEYLMEPPELSMYKDGGTDRLNVFLFSLTNTNPEPRQFPRESWLVTDDIGNNYPYKESIGFDDGPTSTDLVVGGESTQEIWFAFRLPRERSPQEIVWRQGNSAWNAIDYFPKDTDVVAAPKGRLYKRDGERRDDGEYVMWRDWEISNLSLQESSRSIGWIIQMTIANVSEVPRPFPADSFALIDAYGRWYQISSLFMPGTDTYSYGEQIEGVEIDPEKPIEVWISGISELERSIRYLVSLDRELIFLVSET